MQAAQEIVVITGVGGFIGRALSERLAHRFTVAGMDKAGAADPTPSLSIIDLDLSSDDGVARALGQARERFGRRIASIVHLGAYYDVSGEPNPMYERITVQGTRRLIDALQSFEVGQFVFASTMLVHQPTTRPDERIDESSPIEPAWAYPQSKAKAEAVLRERHGEIPLVMLRIAGVYDDEGHSLFIAEQIARIHEHRVVSHFYPGMLCAGQSFVHIDDLVDAVTRVIDRRGTLPQELPLLVGEPEALGYAEMQDIIGCALHGETWKTIRVPLPLARAGAWLQNEAMGDDDAFIKPWMVEEANDHYVLDISLARRLLDWAPRHTLREALPRIVEALKRDPGAWYKTNKLNPALVAWYGQRKAVAAPRAAPPAPPQDPHGERAAVHQAPGADHVRDHMATMEADARRTRWAHYANIGLGLWLAASPVVFDALAGGAASRSLQAVTIDRGLAPIEWRTHMLAASDLLSGLLLALFGALSLSRRTAWFAQWAATVVGLWLLFAPLVFWSPSAAQYQNDMLVGALAIAFSVLVPMMPGMSMEGMMDPKVVPPGWSYCPSTGAQRLPIAALGLLGLLIARMLAAYQMGHVDHVWEPFFAGSLRDGRNGTEEIITSSVSKAWPIPDGGLGAASYMLEVLMAVMGTRARWRTMPWMVTFFGILVIPLGAVSIYFIIIQPIVIGTWSTPALIAAAAMLLMIPLALDEVVAMGQYLGWAHARGRPFLTTFLRGGPVDGGGNDETDHLAAPGALLREAARGLTLPWTLALCTALGASLMFTRLLLGTSGAAANGDHLVGALVVTVSVIATAEVARPLRLVNLLLGVWLLGAPFWLEGAGIWGAVVDRMVGIALIGLGLPRGRRSEEHYAGWDRYVI